MTEDLKHRRSNRVELVRRCRFDDCILRPVIERLECRLLLSGSLSFPVGTGFTAANTSGVVTRNGNAVLSNTSLQLTAASTNQISSAFSNSVVSNQGFDTTFYFTQSGTADGFAFVLQNNSPTAIGLSGGNLGYGSIGNSVAVKFDLYSNAGEGTDSTGLFVNGDIPTLPSGSIPAEASRDMTSSGVVLRSGDAMKAVLGYDGVTLSETVTDTTLNKSYSTTYTINIPATIGSGSAYVGFGGATGGQSSTQKISAWTFAPRAVAPYVPSNLTVTPVSATELDLSWSDPYSTITSYKVYRLISGSYTQVGNPTGATFQNMGLTANTSYSYEVSAVNSVATSSVTAPVSGTTLLLPAVITNLTAGNITASSLTLTWQNSGSSATSSTITRTLVPDNTTATFTLPAGSTSFNDSGLVAGREYDYGVVANTSSGSTQSVGIAANTVPGQVQNFEGTVTGSTASFDWDPLGYAITGYNLYCGTSPGGESPTPLGSNLSGTTYVDHNLTPGTTYYYTVTALDTGGEGIPSIEFSALASTATPTLVISEFMADNKTSITDIAGEHSDWIEIHNAGDADADLSDYYLTDNANNPTLWQFPQQTLAAGGYLIVFADGENVSVAGQELHTNFSLGDAGEYLAIGDINGNVLFSYAPYPVQSADISYGLSDSDNAGSDLQYFGIPTPGAANHPTAAQALFSVPGETFSGTINVALSTPTTGGQIRYTTDRSDPITSSPLYNGSAIAISTTTMLRARVFAPNFTSSVIDSESYIALDSTVSGFNNNLGIVIINTFGQALNDSTDVLAAASFIPATGGTANAIGTTPEYDGRIGLHIRGASSESFPKQQWGVTLWDENDNNVKSSLFGMPADSKWILNDPYSEKSLMQNPLVYKWANETGEYASRTQYVEVFLNTGTSTSINYTSNYWGVYVLEERVKIANGRVDINQMTPQDNTAPADTGGYIWEKDRPASTDATFTTSVYDQTYINVDPEVGDITPTQQSYLANYVDQFETALAAPDFADPVNGYAKYIDVDSFVKMYLMEEMIKNLDGFRLSTYYYKDENGKIFAGPVWDNNLTLGNAGAASGGSTDQLLFGSNPDGWVTTQLSAADDPYYPRLLQDPAFRQAVTDEWSHLRQTVFSTSQLMADIDANVALLSDGNGNYPVGANPTQTPNNAVVRNFEKWKVLTSFEFRNSFYDASGSWITDVTMMKNWLAARVTWMDSQLLVAPAISPAPTSDNSPTSVSFTSFTNTPADTVLLAANASAKALIPTAAVSGWTSISFNDSSWLTGTAGVGYDNNSATQAQFNPLIGLNVGAAAGVNATVYIREAFTLADPTTVQSLILRIKYDDGFVAYLNGVQIAYENATAANDVATPSYNSAATSAVTDAAALNYVDIDVTEFKSYLVSGTNMLAIQALNTSSGDNDLLIAAQLVSRVQTPVASVPTYYTTDGTDPRNSDGSISSSAILYNGAFNLSATTLVTARSLIGSSWSGPVAAVYQFSSPTVAITELNFDPAKPPAGSPYNNDDFEFVELQNYGSTTVNLLGVSFTAGINYTFGNVSLAPGQVGILENNPGAFQSRYTSPNITILGNYLATGQNFSNSGEPVTLVDGLGNTLQSFTYSGTWFLSAAHGTGYSLEVNDPASLPNLSNLSSWRVGTVINGTPGTVPMMLNAPAEYLRLDPAGFADLYNNSTGTGAIESTFQLASVNSMSDAAVAPNSSLSVDYSNGNPLTSTGISFNGAGTGQLYIVGTAGNDTIAVDASTITFNSSSGLSTITYTGASAISFNGGAGNDTLIQTTQPGQNASLTFINATTADTLKLNGGNFTFDAPAISTGYVPVKLGTLSITANTTVTLANAVTVNARTLLMLNSLSFAGFTGAWMGRLDLGANDLNIMNGNTGWISNPINASGTGIISTSAASDPSHLLTLGTLFNNDGAGNKLFGSGTALGTFDGQDVGLNDLLIKYTYFGDANLNGKVDGSDYSRIDSGYFQAASGWNNGDFNYDGVVNGSDYTLIDNAFNTQGAAITDEMATPTAIVASKQSSRVKSGLASTFVPSTRSAIFGPPPLTLPQTLQIDSNDWFNELITGRMHPHGSCAESGDTLILASPATDSTHLTTLDTIINDTGTNIAHLVRMTFSNLLNNFPIGDSNELLKYICVGDANLSGVVDVSDYRGLFLPLKPTTQL